MLDQSAITRVLQKGGGSGGGGDVTNRQRLEQGGHKPKRCLAVP